jgi:hypothetical protein
MRARDVAAIPGRTLGGIDIPDRGHLQVGGSIAYTDASGRKRGGLQIPIVATLPPIPASGVQMVLWGTSSMITDGTGDGKVWIASQSDTEWQPLYYFTDLSGAP